ncbi:hypothetical protein FRC17_007656, partial [Serendipita sp. 399]
MAAQAEPLVYHGEEKLIVSIDIGVTRSAVSYVHAYPGRPLDVRVVTKWPGQPEAAGLPYIPTLVAYCNDQLVACGAEASDLVGDEDYEVARWFKLHLDPQVMRISDQSSASEGDTYPSPRLEIPPLPSQITLQRVFSDLIRYIFEKFQAFFELNTPNGSAVWSRLSSSIAIILPHPSVWDTQQQSFLKQAAQLAGIVQSEDDARLRIEFVTEDEASIHYSLRSLSDQTWLREGAMFAMMEAGIATVESTLYTCKGLTPKLVLEETGGIFVIRAAERHLREKLRESRYGDDESIREMLEIFGKKTKVIFDSTSHFGMVFDGTQERLVIDFAGRRDNDREHGIIQGKFTLNRLEVCKILDTVIIQIIDSCLKLIQGKKVERLFLLGSFGESPYLRLRLKEELGKQGIEVVAVEEF